jgi:hypothetical protein
MSEIHRSGNKVPFSTDSFLTQARDMMTVSRIVFVIFFIPPRIPRGKCRLFLFRLKTAESLKRSLVGVITFKIDLKVKTNLK